ncbi:hypothetical protein TruAng_011983 [Truncatella angustata]|nr:hypothetical protein TruAng_011983 [Truncatella angustata]
MFANGFCRGAHLLYLGIVATASADAISIPPTTGHYHVGVRKLEIPYINTGDPIAPNNVTTSFLATAFYPTSQKGSTKQSPYLDPATAALYEVLKNLTIGTIGNLTSALARDAPAVHDLTAFPTLIFGPGGWGPPTEFYTILLSDLASHGYAVFGLDHPYEQPFVRYPNGTGLYGLPLSFDTGDVDFINTLQTIRVNETIAFIDRLPLVAELLGAPLNQTHIGTLGHSLGGAAALGAALKDERISSGINMDGEFWGVNLPYAELDVLFCFLDRRGTLLLIPVIPRGRRFRKRRQAGGGC